MERQLFTLQARDLLASFIGVILTLASSWLAGRGPLGVPVEPPQGVQPMPPAPQTPPALPRPAPRLDAVQALARYSAAGTGCTCTILGPTPRKGYVAVLTAHHCVGRVGRNFDVILKDGRRFKAICIASDAQADCALGVIKTDESVPYAKIAADDPEPGVKVWQAGYGVGKPEKRYDGTVVSVGQAQTMMKIAFFSGDSGGGIFRDDTNELVSVVCCTQATGRVTNSYGATVKRIRAMLADAERRYTSDGYTFEPDYIGPDEVLPPAEVVES